MTNSNKTPLICSVALFLVLPILGCWTMQLKTFQEPEISSYKELSQIPGLEVYIEPMLNDSEMKKYFGVNLIKKNILAVYISVWNTKSSNSFLMLEDSIKIAQHGKTGINNRPEKDSEIEAYSAMGAYITTDLAGMALAATALSVSYPASLVSGFLVVAPIADVAIPLFASKKFSDASVIKENFEVIKFRPTTLEPGEKKSGFIYFNWDELKEYNEVKLCFSLQASELNEIYHPCFDIFLGSKKDE